MVGLGLALLAAAELGLRAVPGLRGDDPDITWTRIDPFRREGDDLVTRREYLGALRPLRIPVAKARGTLRVLCLGGSSTYGYPYGADAAWPAALERRLRGLYPDRAVEVLNLGGQSYASARVLGLLRGTMRLEPDLVIVCCGDGEFVEDSYRTAVAARGRLGPWLRSLAISQALVRALPAAVEPRPALDAERAGEFLFSPVLQGTLLPPTPARRREARERFGANLRHIAEVAAAGHVPLVLGTLPSNIATWPPDPGGEPPEPGTARRVGALLRRAEALAAAGRREEALLPLGEAVALRGADALLRFRLGRQLLDLGRAEEARPLLEEARDLDPAPVRAASDFTEAVREATRRHGAGLADLERAFAAASPAGITGEELILDFAHPTPRGGALAAEVVAREAIAALRLPMPPREREEAVRRQEAARASAEPEMNADLAFVWGQIYARKGMDERAVEHFRRAIAQGYAGPYARLALGLALRRLGRGEEALAVLEQAYAADDSLTEILLPLARLCREAGRGERAIGLYRRAIGAGLWQAEVHVELAGLLLELGALEGAREAVEEGLRRHPGDCRLTALGGLVQERSGRPAEAARIYREALDADPLCDPARESLGLLQIEAGDWEGAVATFSEGVRLSGEEYPLHHFNLATAYHRGLHDREAALRSYRRFVELAPEGTARVPRELAGALAAERRRGDGGR